jgi:hypothetical protein
MSEGARVESIDAIKDFRAYLTKFADLASRALGDAESDINKTISWLEGDRLNYWSGKIRKCQEAVVKAEEALRQKKLFKDSTGNTPSAVEEIKMLSVAKKNLAEAQQKLTAVKSWTKQIQREYVMYRGNVSRFANDVAQVPGAIAHLANTIMQLEKYTGIAPAEVGELETVGAGSGAGAGGTGSMARAADEMPQEGEIDVAALRERAPGENAIATSKVLEGATNLPGGKVTNDQLNPILGLAVNAPREGEKVLVTPGIESAGKMYLHRMENALGVWLFGLLEGSPPSDYNSTTVGALIKSRPDLRPLLALPTGSIAIIAAGGLTAVYDDRDRNVLKPKAPPVEDKASAEPAEPQAAGAGQNSSENQ